MTDIGTMLAGLNVAPNGGNQTGGTGTVTNVTATAPIASTGGLNPDISFPTWPADAAGFLKNDGAGVLSWDAVTGFVRLLADPTSTFDTGGFHVTLQGVSEAGFCAGTATSPANSALFTGTTETFAHINIRGVGTSSDDGSAIRFGNDVNDFGAASLKLYGPGGGGGGQAPNSFALGTAVGPFELYSLDDAVPSAIKVMQVYNTVTRHQMVFGNVAYQDANPRLGQFQFVFDDPGNQVFSIGSPASDTAVTQLSLHAPADGDLGDGAHFIAYAVPGQTEDLGINVGGFEKVRIYGDNFADSTKIAVEAINPCVTDNATASIFFSATDSGANTSNVSVGIELPNSVGTAGDWVLRVGGTGASGAGTEVARGIGSGTAVFPAGISFAKIAGISPMLVASEQGWDGSIGDPNAPFTVTVGEAGGGSSGSTIGAFFKNNDDSGNADLISLRFSAATGASRRDGLLEFQHSGVEDGTAFFDFNWPEGSPTVSTTIWNNGSVGIGPGQGAPPRAALDVSSLAGISLLAQTSATDGSNANPTLVVAGNTAQTANLTEWRGTDGTTVVGTVSPKGILSLTPDADGATAITLTTTDNGGGVDLFSWDLTTGVEHALGTIGSTGYDSNFHSFSVPTGWNHFSAGPLGAPIFAVSDGGNVDAASYSGPRYTNPANLTIAAGALPDGTGSGSNGDVELDAYNGLGVINGNYILDHLGGHSWSTKKVAAQDEFMTFNGGSGLAVTLNVDAASYSVGAVPGESKTIVLALATSLTFTGGILTADT